uniref:Eukaryotic translation initiation factor 4E-3b n=1 Tax=Amphidinium carterae TaxID=2961 RepID=A0A2Z2FD76_AMPCA|nr:eukaryotic translation initiation factor 4E-3b [Amphidinium carterae]
MAQLLPQGGYLHPPNAWPRPTPGQEPSRQTALLELLYERSALPAEAWRPVVIDEDWRCFSFLAPKAISADRTEYFRTRLLQTAPWVELKNTKGTSVTRSTCWYARGGCTCTYTYGRDLRMANSRSCGGQGASVPVASNNSPTGAVDCPVPEEDSHKEFQATMAEIMEHVFNGVFQGFREEEWPNAANVNLYRDGRQAVGWHADDESLFKGKESDCPIVSISLGASREFWVALKREGGSMEPDPKTVVEVDLQDGDVLTMEGRMQKHCLHLVPKGNPRAPIREERINITFRWVREHKHHCPLRRVQQAVLPRSLGGIFGEVSSPLQPYFPQVLLFTEPYLRSWSMEVAPGFLANPQHTEWRLCDNCKHVCYEEGRPCCEGAGEWSGQWFCRHCWGQWAPSLTGDLPRGPLENFSQVYASGYGAYMEPHPQDCSWWGTCSPTAPPFHTVPEVDMSCWSPTQYAGALGLDPPLQPTTYMANNTLGCLSTAPPKPVSLHGEDRRPPPQPLQSRHPPLCISGIGTLSAGSTAIPSASSGSNTPPAESKDGVDVDADHAAQQQHQDASGGSNRVEHNSRAAESDCPKWTVCGRRGIDALLEGADSLAVNSNNTRSAMRQESGNVDEIRALLLKNKAAGGDAEFFDYALAVLDKKAVEEAGARVQAEQSEEDSEVAGVNGHALESRWALWVLLVRDNLDWSEALSVVHDDICSVEELWGLLAHMHLPSALLDADYSMFLQGVRPAREAPQVLNGGRWILALQSGGNQRGALPVDRYHDVVDKVWLEVVLALLGGSLENEAVNHGDPLSCGVVVSMRGCDKDSLPGDQEPVRKKTNPSAKLALWLKGSQNRGQVRAVGNALLQVVSSTTGAEDVPHGGWRLAFEDFASRSVTQRVSMPGIDHNSSGVVRAEE